MLAKSLGPRWKPHVWENLGWHYTAISPCGQIEVSAHGLRSFWANIVGDDRHRQYAATGTTPRDAVIRALTKAAVDISEITTMLRSATSYTDAWGIEVERARLHSRRRLLTGLR